MDPGRMPWNEFQNYLKESGQRVSKKEASKLYRATKVATGRFLDNLRYSPRKTKATGSDEKLTGSDEKLKTNAVLAGKAAAYGWKNMDDEQRQAVEARLDDDEAFADGYTEALGSIMLLDHESLGQTPAGIVAKKARDEAIGWDDMSLKEKIEALELAERENETKGDDVETEDEADDDDETDDEAADETGEEAKEGSEEAKEGGEEAKEGSEEAKEEKSDLTRTKPMDDDERKDALRFILGKFADRDSLVDDMGLPLGKEQLLSLAKLSPIWSALSNQQKQMFLSENGTFASGNRYVATAKVARKAPTRKTLVQSSSGKRMAL